MTSLEMAKSYLKAWNAHDADAIVATFATDGIYNDPTAGEISGGAVGAYAQNLWSAFPDLSFEIVSIAEVGTDRIVVEWLMSGKNSGAFQGLPATGRSIQLPGIDLIETSEDGIKQVRGYFDSRVVPEQLGLQVLVQPFEIGPFLFGNSTAVHSGNRSEPGAFGITTIWNREAQVEEVRAMTKTIATEMLRMDGFIGATFARIGERGVTISAWEKAEQMKQLMRGGSHSEAMRKFWAEVGYAGFTSVWVPDHINPLWVRCTGCQKMNDYQKNSGVCSCGQRLSEPPAYF